MEKRVLILQSDEAAAAKLADFFLRREDRVWRTADFQQAVMFAKLENPDYVFVDLHISDAHYIEVLSELRVIGCLDRVVVTNRFPDLRRELLAKELGVRVFLREPFTAEWIENTILRLEKVEVDQREHGKATLPRVRFPMQVKITLPYILLAIVFTIAFSYVIGRYILESMQDRFMNQLVDAGKMTADWMVSEEDRILDTIRLLAHTEGVSEAIVATDANALRKLSLPVAVNYNVEALAVLSQAGDAILFMRHIPDGAPEEFEYTSGDQSLKEAEFIKQVLEEEIDSRGDKFAGLFQHPFGDYFYIAGPVIDQNGEQVGAILMGESIRTLVNKARQDTLAQISLYQPNGSVAVSTVFESDQGESLPDWLANEIILEQDSQSKIRNYTVASSNYSEILGAWEVRAGEDLGIWGIALAQNAFSQPSTMTRYRALGIISLAFVGIFVVGVLLARQITQPLGKVVEASREVARGNLEVKVPSNGDDEVAILAHAFNYMVTGLQEGLIYRELLGRTVSPEVRDAMRHSFAKGELKLEGQNTVATVLMSDIRGFTLLAEKEEPATILNWLNEYFGALVPIVTERGGVVDKFEGDAMLAFFGILPALLPAEESAYQACLAGIDLMKMINAINTRRENRKEPKLITGIAINTGTLTAGGLGTSDRLNYTIIGDTVNTTQRMQAVTYDFNESGMVISEGTLEALGKRRSEFRFESLGAHNFRGKSEAIWLYRLRID